MSWTHEAKVEAAMDAPLGRDLHRDDTLLIERPGWYQIVTPSARPMMLNEIERSELAPSECDAAIDQAIATYHPHGITVKWYVGPWTKPDDFGERLARRGFRHWGVRGMCCDTSMRVAVPDDVRTEPVTEANLEPYLDAFLGGWKLGTEQRDPVAVVMRRAMREKLRTAYFFNVLIDGEIAGTTGLLLRDGFAYLIGGNVVHRFRGRGAYRALIECRLAFLRERGITLAVTHARETSSAPMLEHLGFETLFNARCYVLDP